MLGFFWPALFEKENYQADQILPPMTKGCCNIFFPRFPIHCHNYSHSSRINTQFIKLWCYALTSNIFWLTLSKLVSEVRFIELIKFCHQGPRAAVRQNCSHRRHSSQHLWLDLEGFLSLTAQKWTQLPLLSLPVELFFQSNTFQAE